MMIAALALLIDPTVAPQDPPPAPPSVIRLDPQIQSWLDRSPAPRDGERGPIWDNGRVHGEVSVGVGTGGYRSWGGAVDAPIGENGSRFSLRFQQSEGDRRYGRPWGYDPTYWNGALGADDLPMSWADRRPESGAAGQD